MHARSTRPPERMPAREDGRQESLPSQHCRPSSCSGTHGWGMQSTWARAVVGMLLCTFGFLATVILACLFELVDMLSPLLPCACVALVPSLYACIQEQHYSSAASWYLF